MTFARSTLLLGLAGCASHHAVTSLAAGARPMHPTLTSELATTGTLHDRLAPKDDANLVLFYGAEEAGTLDTCGCPKRPRGSIARVVGYREATARSQDVPSVLVDAGNWLDDTIGVDDDLREDVRLTNAWMVKGLEAAGYDALNVGYRDLPYLAEAGFPEEAVSANVRPKDPATPGPKPYRVVQAGALKVAITGVSPEGMTFLQPAGFEYDDEVASVKALAPEMRQSADVVVVLMYGEGDRAQKVVAGLRGLADVAVEAGDFHERYDPFDEDGLVWVRAHAQTLRLGELRMFVGDRHVLGAVDRHVDLDDAVPSAPALVKMTQQQRDEVDAVQKRIFGTW